MPEYLAPGVYVEETSYRSKSVEGVPTTTAGFVGQCRYGPVEGKPKLVTSFDEFRRYFGGVEDLEIDGGQTNYLAHAVKAFFENGGKRCYVARVIAPDTEDDEYADDSQYAASEEMNNGRAALQFHARFPGVAGNTTVEIKARRSGNRHVDGNIQGLQSGDIVQVADKFQAKKVGGGSDEEIFPSQANIGRVTADEDGKLVVRDFDDETRDLGEEAVVQKLTLRVDVHFEGRVNSYSELTTQGDSNQFIGDVLRDEDRETETPPLEDSTAFVNAKVTNPDKPSGADALGLFLALAPTTADTSNPRVNLVELTGGSDGGELSADLVDGQGTNDDAYGLAALGEIKDVAIVAAPGAVEVAGSDDEAQAIRNNLISHCEKHEYRTAIVSGQRGASVERIRDVRAQHDSSYAALYYPWVVISDPNDSRGEVLEVPPDGFVAGIYARNDIERGAHKAPANEIVRGALDFSREIGRDEQEVLNPEGINCLRFFEGRGYRVWGARTMSSDPEWKYVNVRRFFNYLQHSIDESTQWAVFEPNNRDLWTKLRVMIEAFLLNEQKKGAIMGRKPEEGFFVRCDRSTMTQQDIDDGRVIVEIGVAPTKPAEFVIFRVGQWTADSDEV